MIAIYARQSVEKKDSISIESQIEYAKFLRRISKSIRTAAIPARTQTALPSMK